MFYIITIEPEQIDDLDIFLVLNCRGSWNSRSKKNPLHGIGPTGPFLRYFQSEAEAYLVIGKLDPAQHPKGRVGVVEISDQNPKTLSEIQTELSWTWTLSSYSETFKGSTLPWRDFQHSLLHVMKATGKLAAIVEDADHKNEPSLAPFSPPEKVANYLADLVICAIRMASKHPYGEIDIENAVMARIKEKADVPVES